MPPPWTEEDRHPPLQAPLPPHQSTSSSLPGDYNRYQAQIQQRQRNEAYQQSLTAPLPPPPPPSQQPQQQPTFQPSGAQRAGFPTAQNAPGQPMAYQYMPPENLSGSHFGSFPSLQAHGYASDPSQHGYYDARASPRSFVAIAPDPAGLQRMQSLRSGVELGPMDDGSVQRQHSTSSNYRESPTPPMLREEDKLLLQLKDDETLPWRDIVARISSETGQNFQIPALQMRYRRLKDRMRVWTAQDVDALRKAYEYWETKKFEIIASKMQDFGVEEKWTPRACQRKWNELNPGGGGDADPSLSRRSTLYSQSPQAPYTFQMEPGSYGSGSYSQQQTHGHW